MTSTAKVEGPYMGHRIVTTLVDPESGEHVHQDETGARYDASNWSLNDAGEWLEGSLEPEPEADEEEEPDARP